MRCLSPHANYSIQAIEGHEQVVLDARGYAHTQQIKKPVIADFHQGGLLDYEIEAALERFNFSGIPEGVNPLTRISCFDSEAYVQRLPVTEQDAMIVQIDQRLRYLQSQHPNEFIIVEPPQAARPWPSYDGDSVEDILKFQERLRIDTTLIRRYELENKNRPEVVLAMLRKEDPDAAVALEADLAEGSPEGDVVPVEAAPVEEEPVVVDA